MSYRISLVAAAAVLLSGCAATLPQSEYKLMSLPVVEFPATPPAGEFVLKLPAGKPIPTRVLIEGSALASGADQILNATLPHDLYVYQRWVSEDGKTWRPTSDVLDIKVNVTLPSTEHPTAGEIRLTVNRKAGQ